MTRIKSALDQTGLKFKHFAWSPAPAAEYGTYEESDAADFIVDGLHQEKGIIGYVHYFTRKDDGSVQKTIEDALEGVCAWHLNSVQYENETGLIHYEWEVGLYGKPQNAGNV